MLRPEAGALTPDGEDDDESSVPNYGPHTKPKDCSLKVRLWNTRATLTVWEETLKVSTPLFEFYLMLRSKYFWKLEVRDSFILPTDDTHFAYYC